MSAAAPAYFFQRRLDGLYTIYDGRGPVPGYEEIDTRGGAEAHILDLIEADRIRALEDAADLDDFEAQRLVEAA